MIYLPYKYKHYAENLQAKTLHTLNQRVCKVSAHYLSESRIDADYAEGAEWGKVGRMEGDVVERSTIKDECATAVSKWLV